MSEVKHKWADASDHKMTTAKYTDQSTKIGPGLWKHNNDLLKSPDYCETIKNVITQTINLIHPPQETWELIKKAIGETARAYGKEQAKIKAEGKNRLKTILNNEKDHTINEIQEARKGLAKIAEAEARSVIFRSRAEYVEKNEKCTPYFFKRIANNRSHTNIQQLNVDGTITKDSRAIEKEISGSTKTFTAKKTKETKPYLSI